MAPVWHRVLFDRVDALLRHLVDDCHVLVTATKLNQDVAWDWNVARSVAMEGQLLVVYPIRAHAIDVVEGSPALLGIQPTREFGALARAVHVDTLALEPLLAVDRGASAREVGDAGLWCAFD